MPATKIKIWRGKYTDLFTLLLCDVEVKEGAKNDSKELERIKHRQVDKNFTNWLLTYTLYMGVVCICSLKGPI